MWTINSMGRAQWRSADSVWSIDARGGVHGIGTDPADDSIGGAVTFAPVEHDAFPIADEQFVRGDQWHVNYPQGDHSYALRLQWVPIETTSTRLVIEACLSIQTDLLDSNPTIDIDAPCERVGSLGVHDARYPDHASDQTEAGCPGSPPISIANSSGHTIAVLLGPHDAPFTSNHSTDTRLRLRLFGEFLERGVIRRARPWIVIDRSGTRPTDDELQSLWQQLVQSPLPLT